MVFYNILITWYLANKRDLPWRKTTNPYYIWLSEIILQQTRVAQGLPYYNAFIAQFPKVSDLANARQEEVLKLWQGLGYYSRARNLHETAQHISFNLNNEFPKSYAELIKLKGIGTYTAAAIASIAYNEPVAVVDGNVFRVLARIFNIQEDISKAKTKAIFQQLANTLLLEPQAYNPALFNQAIMDFGALQCVPKSPNCTICPFTNLCFAYANKKVDQLPVKNTKTKVTTRYFDYILVKGSNNKFVINKREAADIWQGLHEFNLLENAEFILIDQIENQIIKQFKDFEITNLFCFTPDYYVHKLSHQHLNIRFWLLETSTNVKGFNKEMIDKFSYPIVIANFIKNNYDRF